MAIFITFAESEIGDEGPATFTGAVAFNRVASIFVAQYYNGTAETILNQPFPVNRTNVAQVTYLLGVKNDGEIKLHDVVLADTLPQRMLYDASWYYNDPKVHLDPEVVSNDDGTTNRIQWKLGDFETGQEKWIILKVRHSATESQQIRSKYRENVVEASAPVEGSEQVTYISNQAQGIRPSEWKRMLDDTQI
jgi:uncharacterized repeat protein (TIGR01451 family)